MCIEDVFKRLEEIGIDVGHTAKNSVLFSRQQEMKGFDITGLGSHPCDVLVEIN